MPTPLRPLTGPERRLIPTNVENADTPSRADIAPRAARQRFAGLSLPIRKGRRVFAGVMAQEILPVVLYAVIVSEDGNMRVNDAILGTHLVTCEKWLKASAHGRSNPARVD